MSNTLYLECLSGISGDMTVAALLDLGADRQVLEKALDSLPVDGFSIEIKRVVKSGLDVCDFNVVLDKAHENHDHDMEYLHGKEAPENTGLEHSHAHGHGAEGHIHSHDHEKEGHTHDHVHGEEGHTHDHVHGEEGHTHSHDHGVEGHSHDHVVEEHVHFHDHDTAEHTHSHGHAAAEISHIHGEEEHHHPHEHRGLKEILHIISHAQITDRAKEIANRIFQILAEAESAAHGVPAEEVHFHEVGAVDSIVDIVAAAVCLDNLDIDQVIVPKLCEGSGFVRCQHGTIPVPVPAVANIAGRHGLKLQITDVQGELVTPTGAAIVAAVKTADTLPETFTILRTGMGAGKRSYERPSLLRAMLIRSEARERDTICKLETNIDDCTGEMMGYVMELLFEAGARDVHYMPVFMKKNRPAYQLNVICREEDAHKLEDIIFRETTTIGIRRCHMDRTVLKREMLQVSTELGQAAVKVCYLEDQVRYYPEYSSVTELCRKHNRRSRRFMR
ncbi:MAG: nickel pincer cofactor biosynthesis protein LarC [Eisenbergiella sp.]